jgi:hypothetical protein
MLRVDCLDLAGVTANVTVLDHQSVYSLDMLAPLHSLQNP